MMRCAVLWLALSCCSPDERTVDLPDINLTAPSAQDLESRLAAFREGREKFHGDPKQVAHGALVDHVDVPWRGEPYRAEDYQFHLRNSKNPEWGSYVVRGFVERTGARRTRRYRVKIRPYEEIWYPIQVSRYFVMEFGEDPESEDPPNVRKQ
jgi:hypothetical protein